MTGLVVAPEPLAAEHGARLLSKGGNAVDAAVAACMVQAVVNPLHTGLGGTGTIFVQMSGKPALVLDCSAACGSGDVPVQWYQGEINRSERFGRYIIPGDDNQHGYRSIMTPGLVRGLHHARDRLGSKRICWSDVVEPALSLADNGFEIDHYVAGLWADTDHQPGYPGYRYKLGLCKAAADAFLNPGQQPLVAGDLLVQTDLARTLAAIAREPDTMYTGEISRLIAADIESGGGFVTLADMEQFEVEPGFTVTGRFRDCDLSAPGVFASGTQVIEMLQILDGCDLSTMEHNDARYVDLLTRIMRAGFQDNVQLKGDPPYSIGARLTSRFLDPKWAARWRDHILAGESVRGAQGGAGGDGTSHVTVADADGNLACITSSIGSLAGSGVVTEGLGFLYNNYLGHFNPRPFQPDSITPGKRGIGGAPVIVTRGGQPVLVLGAPGGSRLITSVFQVVVNVLVWGMSVCEAVSVPRVHSEQDGLVFVEPAVSDALVGELTAMGLTVRRRPDMASVHAIAVDSHTSKYEPGADPRAGRGVGYGS